MSEQQPTDPRGVLIVDLGTQYTQLIARRIREAGTWCEITIPDHALERARAMDLGGIVLSGGPASVYEADSPRPPREVLELGVGVLGICYGMQWMCQELGGKVRASDRREYGRTSMEVTGAAGLFEGLAGATDVWMSHGDRVEALPEGFATHAGSANCEHAAVSGDGGRLWGVQFHPEVTHTPRGREMIANFLGRVCRLPGDWRSDSIVEREVAKVRAQVGETGEIVLGLSGGVDSSVAAMILREAIGDRLHAIFVDNGLLRKGERDAVERTFRDRFQLDLSVVDASERFLAKLVGVTDPERKRKVIGYEFIEVFREEATRFTDARFLGQGTLYPDVIESVAAHGGSTAVIKSHHNVGGLPEDMDMELVEPLRELFKDEVREIGRFLGLDGVLVDRQPFPGPGLGVRIVGEVTPERVATLQEADHIMTTEIEASGEAEGLWQYFAVLLPVRSVGVMGDARTYEDACALRVVKSLDGMTADWAHLPPELVGRISNRIINEVRGINRVVLDVTSKPPGTIEWE
ncbi:MAG: glutamine-hydrolyzing GMP synthase [Planctomycetota bacterium]|jgi:GMP synthase (glutamine-hydrolysing)|nr:glutamine-hydrolyzing GMP synthase [Planctomycetota bacterium]MDP6764154.1 glutamine-hydrolyzing GMP synthase [Planctomycetota bacterium]MDP6988221.1 glutamine-hydrolyzing GMP synthase [Planctomycetota bacterium]